MIIKSSLLFIDFNCLGGHHNLMSFSVSMHLTLNALVFSLLRSLIFFPPTLFWDYSQFGTLEYRFTDNIHQFLP